MQRRYNLAHLILAIVMVSSLTPLMVVVDVQARIVFMSDRDWNWEIYVMDNHGGNQRNLSNNPGDDREPSWSPDGKRIVFSSNRDGKREIYVMDADGDNQLNLSNNDLEDWAPSWSPDGKRIVFVRDEQIHVMDADGGNQLNLTENVFNHSNPSWSPDGRHIVFVLPRRRDGNEDIYVMDADGSDGRRWEQSAKSHL